MISYSILYMKKLKMVRSLQNAQHSLNVNHKVKTEKGLLIFSRKISNMFSAYVY